MQSYGKDSMKLVIHYLKGMEPQHRSILSGTPCPFMSTPKHSKKPVSKPRKSKVAPKPAPAPKPIGDMQRRKKLY